MVVFVKVMLIQLTPKFPDSSSLVTHRKNLKYIGSKPTCLTAAPKARDNSRAFFESLKKKEKQFLIARAGADFWMAIQISPFHTVMPTVTRSQLVANDGKNPIFLGIGLYGELACPSGLIYEGIQGHAKHHVVTVNWYAHGYLG
jgi:hypothetical protein